MDLIAAPMPSSRTLIARHLQAVLQAELDHVIDTELLLGSAHYARDVLLVCDAMRSSDLAALAAQFRATSGGLPLASPVPRPAPDPAPEAEPDPPRVHWPDSAEVPLATTRPRKRR